MFVILHVPIHRTYLVLVRYLNNKIQKKSTNLTLIITCFPVKSLHAE